MNNPDQGEEYFDQGSLALVRGEQPLLINARAGWSTSRAAHADENRSTTTTYGQLQRHRLPGQSPALQHLLRAQHQWQHGADRYGQDANTTEDDAVRTRSRHYEDGR